MKAQRYRHRYDALYEELNQEKAKLSLLNEQLDTEKAKIGSSLERKVHLQEVIALLSKTAEDAREVGRQRLETVVTKALQSVFGPDFGFRIELDESGGKPTARFLVQSIGENGEVIENEPQDSRGGGINDIVATALQVAVRVVYNEPKIRGPLLLDEPGKHVSEEYAVKFGEFLDFVSRTFGIQIIMVTHQPHLAMTADRTLVTQLIGGRTVTKEHKDGDIDESDA